MPWGTPCLQHPPGTPGPTLRPGPAVSRGCAHRRGRGTTCRVRGESRLQRCACTAKDTSCQADISPPSARQSQSSRGSPGHSSTSPAFAEGTAGPLAPCIALCTRLERHHGPGEHGESGNVCVPGASRQPAALHHSGHAFAPLHGAWLQLGGDAARSRGRQEALGGFGEPPSTHPSCPVTRRSCSDAGPSLAETNQSGQGAGSLPGAGGEESSEASAPHVGVLHVHVPAMRLP